MPLLPRTALSATRLWVGLGVGLMLANGVSSRAFETQEFHPFFDWRLYSAPPGWDRDDAAISADHLYAQGPDGSWARIAFDPATLGYTRQQMMWQLGYLSDHRDEPDARADLLLLAQRASGTDGPFALVEEWYSPARALQDLPPDTLHLGRLDLP